MEITHCELGAGRQHAPLPPNDFEVAIYDLKDQSSSQWPNPIGLLSPEVEATPYCSGPTGGVRDAAGH